MENIVKMHEPTINKRKYVHVITLRFSYFGHASQFSKQIKNTVR